MSDEIKHKTYAMGFKVSTDMGSDSIVTRLIDCGLQDALTRHQDEMIRALADGTYKPAAPLPPPARLQRFRNWLGLKLHTLAVKVGDEDVVCPYDPYY